MWSSDYEYDIVSLPLSEEDAFNSHGSLGHIAYRLPALDDLFGLPMSFLDMKDEYTFVLYVYSYDQNGRANVLRCQNQKLCKVTYKKIGTPVIQQITPQVVYFESLAQIRFDPKLTGNYITGLKDDELPFINARIGGALLDFEGFVDNESVIHANNPYNFVKGQVGELLPTLSTNVSMHWETGQSWVKPVQSLTCTFDNSTCY